MKYRISVPYIRLTKEFDNLLDALFYRNTLLSVMPNYSHLILVDELDGKVWNRFDAETYLEGLARLLAPAES